MPNPVFKMPLLQSARTGGACNRPCAFCGPVTEVAPAQDWCGRMVQATELFINPFGISGVSPLAWRELQVRVSFQGFALPLLCCMSWLCLMDMQGKAASKPL